MNKKLYIILPILTLIIAGIGWWFIASSDTTGTDSSTDVQRQDSQDGVETSAEENQGLESSSAVGTVTVDGVEYTIAETVACEQNEDDQIAMIETELELQGLGTKDGERVQIDVYIETIAGEPNNSISWSGPEGVYGMGEALSAEIVQADGRVSGSAELVDARTFTDPIDVAFSLDVPTSTASCR